MRSPIEVMLTVADIGGRLRPGEGAKLTMLLPPDCPPKLKAAIRHHKIALLELLQRHFLIVRSDALNTVVLWAPDNTTKEALIAAGADAGIIYTPDELARLIKHRVTIDELQAIHKAKVRFNGKLTA